MKPAVVVTGAGGFLGRSICPALERDWRVIRVVSPRSPLQGPDVFRADLACPADVQRLVKGLNGLGSPTVVHLAFVLPKGGDERVDSLVTRNHALTSNTAALVRAIGARCLVNFSSLAVYPVRSGTYTEDSPVDPSGNTQCLYALAKFNSEVMFAFMLGKTMPVVNLRLTQTYGPNCPSTLYPGRVREDIMRNGSVDIFGGGERVSNFIHVDDAALALLAVLAAPKAGTYNLACETNLSYLEVAQFVAASVGLDKSCIRVKEHGIRDKCFISGDKFAAAWGLRLNKIDFDQ